MTHDSGDRGVNISGGANVSGQVATGDDVSQTQQFGAALPAGATVAFTEVERLLERHADELDEADKARRDLADLQREAAEADPDDERMEGALGRLGRRVGGVAALAEAVKQLAAQLGLG